MPITRYVLIGRIVTMNASDEVIPAGAIYVDQATIMAVQPAAASPPPGWEDVPRVRTRGTIYPGLIDLHNHLSYNILPLWNVPKRYSNRDQWGGAANPDYRKIISGPMTVLGKTAGYLEAIVRYVEAKCLIGGVTTSQGIELFSNQGIGRYFRGALRNVEQTDDPALPHAVAKISDVEATSVEKFRARLRRATCMLLHLSEGLDEKARRHFLTLKPADGEWAIEASLTGIHCAGLVEQDFEVLGARGGSMIWSPLSNLLLYGGTARVAAAKRHGVSIGLGSDWSPSGSKNLLGELKIARIVSEVAGGIFTDRELVAMATRDAAAILRWDAAIGTLEPGKRADLLVLAGSSREPYRDLITAPETAIQLVVVDGRPHYGMPRLMRALEAGAERWRLAGRDRLFDFDSPDNQEILTGISLGDARRRLVDGLEHLPELARDLEQPSRRRRGAAAEQAPAWTLVLEHEEPEGLALRPHFDAGPDFRSMRLTRAPSAPLSQVLEPIGLDPLTAADDPTFVDRLRQQHNLPPAIKEGLTVFA